MKFDTNAHKPSIHSRTKRCPECGDTLYSDALGRMLHFYTQLALCDSEDMRWAEPRA